MFKGTTIPTVVITLNESIAGKLTPLLLLKLKNAFITSIVDADANAAVPSEKITMGYEIIEIQDPINHSMVTCDLPNQVCN